MSQMVKCKNHHPPTFRRCKPLRDVFISDTVILQMEKTRLSYTSKKLKNFFNLNSMVKGKTKVRLLSYFCHTFYYYTTILYFILYYTILYYYHTETAFVGGGYYER